MKVKLLKKIRKEFSINHYPNGCVKTRPGFRSTPLWPNETYGPNTYTLEHNGNVLAALDLSKGHATNKTPQVIYSDLKKLLVFHINEIYGHYGTRRLNKVKVQQSPKKLWYQIK